MRIELAKLTKDTSLCFFIPELVLDRIYLHMMSETPEFFNGIKLGLKTYAKLERSLYCHRNHKNTIARGIWWGQYIAKSALKSSPQNMNEIESMQKFIFKRISQLNYSIKELSEFTGLKDFIIRNLLELRSSVPFSTVEKVYNQLLPYDQNNHQSDDMLKIKYFCTLYDFTQKELSRLIKKESLPCSSDLSKILDNYFLY